MEKIRVLIADDMKVIAENVKEIVFAEALSAYMNFTVKPNFKVVGKIFGPQIKDFSAKLENLSNADITKLNNGESLTMDINGTSYEITKEMVDIRISAKEGFNVGMENNNFIILNTELTKELILEGLAREFVSKVQNMRKNADYNVSDRIYISYNGDDDIKEMLSEFKDYVQNEVLALEITYKEEISNQIDINGHVVNIEIKRA